MASLVPTHLNCSAIPDLILLCRWCWILICVWFPFAWPMSKLLDRILGDEHTSFYRRAELKELVVRHSEKAENGHAEISVREVAT
jgi:hypothetical protein